MKPRVVWLVVVLVLAAFYVGKWTGEAVAREGCEQYDAPAQKGA